MLTYDLSITNIPIPLAAHICHIFKGSTTIVLVNNKIRYQIANFWQKTK